MKRFLLIVIAGLLIGVNWQMTVVANEQEQKEWKKINNSIIDSDYEDYLFLFPKSPFVELARRRLHSLIQNQKNQTTPAPDIIPPNQSAENAVAPCPLCDGWSDSTGENNLQLIAKGKARFETYSQQSKVRCVEEFKTWFFEENRMIFQEGQKYCSDRTQRSREQLVVTFLIKNRDTLELISDQTISYARQTKLKIEPQSQTSIPLLCLSKTCVESNKSDCQRWQIQFQCIEYTYQGTSCEDQLGQEWSEPSYSLVKSTPPESMAECREVCKNAETQPFGPQFKVICLAP
ncbi:hypothetical protein WDW89_12160 [Deltaproteobacteria bacterium TL4]